MLPTGNLFLYFEIVDFADSVPHTGYMNKNQNVCPDCDYDALEYVEDGAFCNMCDLFISGVK